MSDRTNFMGDGICNLQFAGEVNFKSSMPEKAVVVDPTIFDRNAMLALKRKNYKVEGFAASKPGMTCDQVTFVLYYLHPAQADLPSIVSPLHFPPTCYLHMLHIEPFIALIVYFLSIRCALQAACHVE